MRRLVLAFTLAVTAAAWLAADSRSASLRVGATVTRRCAVATGITLEVQCTRSSASAVQASVDGRALAPAPLRLSGPGTASASVPLEAGSGARVLTVLF